MTATSAIEARIAARQAEVAKKAAAAMRPPMPTLPPIGPATERHLRHIGMVHSFRRNVALTGGVFAVLIGAGVGVPAYAGVVNASSVPALQTLAVSSAVTETTAVPRDGYAVTILPPLVFPVDRNTVVISGFGSRAAGCEACSTMHEGVDLGAPNGSDVRSIALGTVVETDNPGYSALGVHVAIEHEIDGQKVVSAYAHLQNGSMSLKVGDIVAPGQVVGRVGQTGVATAPHLHFEIRLNGTQYVDGRAWLLGKLG